MTLLDEAVAKRSNCLIFLRNDPRLEPIRQHPHFPVLLNRVGLDDVAVASYKRCSPVALIMLAQAYGYAGQKEKVLPLLEEGGERGYVCMPLRISRGVHQHRRRGTRDDAAR